MRKRPSTYTRYGSDHAARRKTLVAEVARGAVPAICCRCGQGPRPGDPWEAGHLIPHGGSSEVRLEHRSCNRRHGARLKEAMRKARFFPKGSDIAISPERSRSGPLAGEVLCTTEYDNEPFV
jgi:hypothetical protein